MFQRTLKLPKGHSFFLFGPRGVGKSTLLESVLPKESTYKLDLLDFDLETRLLNRPGEFAEILQSLPENIRWIFIDEIQKLPFLLNEVHRHIERHPRRFFAMTGSSARKLRRGQANLLAGRAFSLALHPLTSRELGNAFRLDRELRFGTLPKIFSLDADEDKRQFLRAYAETYLKEEIQLEGFLRNLPAFRRFLPLAAAQNGQVLSWSQFSQDTGVDAKTVRSYFEILEDTLVGFSLPAYQRSLRKRQKTHPKFYFFDTGVQRALAGQLNVDVVPGTTEYGRAFEHFWILEIIRQSKYHNADWSFSYLATHNIEVDLVIERPDRSMVFAEMKSTERVRSSDIRTIATLAEEIKRSEAICICSEPRKRRVGNVLVCPWEEALTELGL